MEYQLSDMELEFAEKDALECAARFLSGWQDWNEDNVLQMACDHAGHDYDFAWLMTRVLFGPAVVYLSTGKTV
jgi:hypothetical protein